MPPWSNLKWFWFTWWRHQQPNHIWWATFIPCSITKGYYKMTTQHPLSKKWFCRNQEGHLRKLDVQQSLSWDQKQCQINTVHILELAIEFFSIKSVGKADCPVNFWRILGNKRITFYCHRSSQCSLSLCAITSASGRSQYHLSNIDNKKYKMGQVGANKKIPITLLNEGWFVPRGAVNFLPHH